MNFGRQTAQALLDLGALKVSRSAPFIYASRKIGPIYIDVRLLASDPRKWLTAVQELRALITAEVETSRIALISGGEVADLLFSIPVAMRLRKPHLIIRKEPKGHGLGGRVVGPLRKGQHVLHVSDLITRGTSALDWVNAIRRAGGIIRDYVTLFDRMQGGLQALAAQGVRLHALVRLDEALRSGGRGASQLTEDDRRAAVTYLADPEAWAQSALRENPTVLQRAIEAVGGRITRRVGLEVLTVGYPELLTELRRHIVSRLQALGVREAVPEVGYAPSIHAR